MKQRARGAPSHPSLLHRTLGRELQAVGPGRTNRHPSMYHAQAYSILHALQGNGLGSTSRGLSLELLQKCKRGGLFSYVHYKYKENKSVLGTGQCGQTAQRVGRKRKQLTNEVVCLKSAGKSVTELRPAPASPVPHSVHRRGLSKMLLLTAARMSKTGSYSCSWSPDLLSRTLTDVNSLICLVQFLIFATICCSQGLILLNGNNGLQISNENQMQHMLQDAGIPL